MTGKRQKTSQTEEEIVEDEEDDLDLPINNDYSYFQEVETGLDKKDYFEREISTKEEIEELNRQMEEDDAKIRELMAHLKEYFSERVDQMGINNREFEITIPLEFGGMRFVTILSLSSAWIFIKCKIMSLDKIAEKVRTMLFERALVANFELNAVFYSVDPKMASIWIENDIPTAELSMESFDIKFNAILFGIKYFLEKIADPLDQHLVSTFEPDHLYT